MSFPVTYCSHVAISFARSEVHNKGRIGVGGGREGGREGSKANHNTKSKFQALNGKSNIH